MGNGKLGIGRGGFHQQYAPVINHLINPPPTNGQSQDTSLKIQGVGFTNNLYLKVTISSTRLPMLIFRKTMLGV